MVKRLGSRVRWVGPGEPSEDRWTLGTSLEGRRGSEHDDVGSVGEEEGVQGVCTGTVTHALPPVTGV